MMRAFLFFCRPGPLRSIVVKALPSLVEDPEEGCDHLSHRIKASGGGPLVSYTLSAMQPAVNIVIITGVGV